MRRDPGSCDRARKIALASLVDQGCTALEAKVGAHVASYGRVCFQTDKALVEIFERDYGHKYHRESIARARRNLSRATFVRSKRLFPGQKVQGMKRGSTHGTTAKYFRWDALALSNPHTRRERAIQAALEAKERRDAEDERQRLERERRAGMPRHSAPPPTVIESSRPTTDDHELAEILDEFVNTQALRLQRASAIPAVTSAGPIEAKLPTRDRSPP